MTKEDIEYLKSMAECGPDMTERQERRCSRVVDDMKMLLLESEERKRQFHAAVSRIAELEIDLARGLNVEFQRTNCCKCGVYKHTPVRCDVLQGYICGGCLENAFLDSCDRVQAVEARIAVLEEENARLRTEVTELKTALSLTCELHGCVSKSCTAEIYHGDALKLMDESDRLRAESFRLSEGVKDWTGMHHIAATRADAAEASEAKLLDALREIVDLKGMPSGTTFEKIARAAIESAETRKK